MEALAVGEREPNGGEAGPGVVGVDVDDRDLEALGEVARVGGGAAGLRIGREPELVVRDDVERAAGLVAVEPREVERLGDDSLAGEGGVAVDQDRQRGVLEIPRRPRVGSDVVAGSRHALDHRIDVLEVARVRRHLDEDLDVLLLLADRAPAAEVVLHVAVPVGALVVGGRRGRVGAPASLELRDDRRVGLAEDVGEHVEPAPMRHPDDDLADLGVRRFFDRLVEHRDEEVVPLDGEARLAWIGAVEEALERLDLREALEEGDVAPWVGREAVALGLDGVVEPAAGGRIGYLGELVAGSREVDLPEALERLEGARRLGGAGAADGPGGHRLEVGEGEPVRRRVERWVGRVIAGERIEPGRAVAERADRLGKLGDPGGERLVDRWRGGRGRRGFRRLCRLPAREPGASRGVDRIGVPLVALEKLEDVPRVRTVEVTKVEISGHRASLPLYNHAR